MTNLKCTRFKSLRSTTPVEVVNITEVLQEIGSEKYRSQVEKIRAEENPSKSPRKDRLPVFTPTGVFSHRSIAGLSEYNGIICLDIDGVEDAEALKTRAAKLSYVYGAFITPSGNGLKVIIPTDATPETYKTAELEVADAFALDAGGVRDNHCKDISRIQFVSYDPAVYINENAITFKTIK